MEHSEQADDSVLPAGVLAYLPSVRQSGTERFHLGEQIVGDSLLSFWQWSASDLVGNTMRGCLAEYIVAMALGLNSGVRNDWEAYDLLFEGIKIEVKASGYLQTWPQKRLSRPVFSIRPARAWDPVTGQMSTDLRRNSDLYVFCLHHHRDKATLNPMDLSQWTFYVLPTKQLDEHAEFQGCKAITLSTLSTLQPVESTFAMLRECIIKAAIDSSSAAKERTS
jgi:hypothetical protein